MTSRTILTGVQHTVSVVDRFEDRIEVAAIAPEGSGIRHNLHYNRQLYSLYSKLNLGRYKLI